MPQSFSLTPTTIGTTSFTWKYGWPESSGSSDRRCTRGKLQSAVLRDHARGVGPAVVGDRLIHDGVDIFRQQKPLGDEHFGGRAHCRGIVLARRVPFGSRRPSRWRRQVAGEARAKHVRDAVRSLDASPGVAAVQEPRAVVCRLISEAGPTAVPSMATSHAPHTANFQADARPRYLSSLGCCCGRRRRS